MEKEYLNNTEKERALSLLLRLLHYKEEVLLLWKFSWVFTVFGCGFLNSNLEKRI